MGQEPENLFTPAEKLILQEHFNANDPITPFDIKGLGDVYVATIYGACVMGVGTFKTTGPYIMNFITNSPTQFNAGDFDGEGNLFGVSMDADYTTATLVKINKTSGVETVVGIITGSGTSVITGLSWNYANQTMYALGTKYHNPTDSYKSSLYTINLDNGTLTLVGETGNPQGIWLAIDNTGNAFMFDVSTDKLYTVDLATGAGTMIGSAGVDLSRAQDADFDPNTGILYAVGYHNGGLSKVYSVNTTTGTFTNKGIVNNSCAQIGLFAIEAGPSAGISKTSLNGFSFYPNSSTDFINLQSEQNIDVVTIYNLLGMPVLNTTVNAAESKIDISALSAGSYMMKVLVNGEFGTYMFVKK